MKEGPQDLAQYAVPRGIASEVALVRILCDAGAAFEYWYSILDREDSPEAVHKARVALRRLRVALDAFRNLLDSDLHDDINDRARQYFRVLGRVRDLDVMAENPATRHLSDQIQKEATNELKHARRRLKKTRAASFADKIEKKLSGKSWRKSGKATKALLASPIETAALVVLDRAWKDCLQSGPNILAMSFHDQHELRKNLKSLRYLTDSFADLWPDRSAEGFLALLKNLQDDLGMLSDLQIAEKRGLTAEIEAMRKGPAERAAQDWLALQHSGRWWDQPTRLP